MKWQEILGLLEIYFYRKFNTWTVPKLLSLEIHKISSFSQKHHSLSTVLHCVPFPKRYFYFDHHNNIRANKFPLLLQQTMFSPQSLITDIVSRIPSIYLYTRGNWVRALPSCTPQKEDLTLSWSQKDVFWKESNVTLVASAASVLNNSSTFSFLWVE